MPFFLALSHQFSHFRVLNIYSITGAGGEAASAALTEAMQDIPEQRIVRLAREGSSLNRALVAAHALRRLHPMDTLDYQKVGRFNKFELEFEEKGQFQLKKKHWC